MVILVVYLTLKGLVLLFDLSINVNILFFSLGVFYIFPWSLYRTKRLFLFI